MLEPQTLKFLQGLKKNNNKPWFDAHRPQYEAALIDFQNFIQLVIDAFGKTEVSIAGQTARSCLFRINRDVRFSNDKSPYKTNFGASIKPGGRKSGLAGYYFHLEPGASFIGGGLWMPEPADVKKVRQEIDYNWDQFQSIIGAKGFQNIYGDVYQHPDISLSTAPKGYEKDHPAIGFLKLKCFTASAKIADKELMSKNFVRNTSEKLIALKPLNEFLNRALQE